jgi:hypothetical protein
MTSINFIRFIIFTGQFRFKDSSFVTTQAQRGKGTETQRKKQLRAFALL